ncbi:MAG: D-alanyl-D-alanine carboxypeptidase/D-alanyl-D-alanine-endopeptidase [Rhodothermales bacterium]
MNRRQPTANQNGLRVHGPHLARPPIFRLTRILIVAAILALPAGTASGQRGASIDELLSGPAAQPAFWGVYVYDLTTEAPYYSHGAQNGYLPASNQKILTSAAALDALGSNHRYRTVLYLDGNLDGSTLRGDLVIRGAGDPTFGSKDAPGPDPLRDWARRLADMGVTRFEGRIVGDDNVFDDRPYSEGWDIDYVTSEASQWVGASIGGLAYSDNVVDVRITARSPGTAPQIRRQPDGFLQIRNQITTASRTRGIGVTTRRDFGSEQLFLEGSIPRTYDGTIVVPVTNPTAFAVESFARYLSEAGIEVAAGAYDIDDLDGFTYATDTPLFVYVSPTMDEILRIVNKESNNFYAEQVFRSIGWGGSAAAAENRVKQLLQRAGASTRAVAIRDGSGLSRKNMVTPEAMGRLLAYMYEHPERDAFFDSLARGGEAGSTLRYRLHNVSVQAKTGSLEFVRALSGYVTAPDGRTFAFSILVNNYSGPSYQITQTIDRIVMELAAFTS